MVQKIIEGILGSVDYALTKETLNKYQQIHLLTILHSANAIVKGKDFKFNCIDCDFHSNGKNAAIDHKLKDHVVSGPAGWFCRTCNYVTSSHQMVILHQKVNWMHRVFRFEEFKTQKSTELELTS